MLFVVDKPKLKRMIAIARDDRSRSSKKKLDPFLRLEAAGGTLLISGDTVEIEIPATVYEPGVLFLRTTLFRRMLNALTIDEMKTRFLTFQVHEDGLRFEDVRFGFDRLDMLLYPDPTTAPRHHPEVHFPGGPNDPTDPQGQLFPP